MGNADKKVNKIGTGSVVAEFAGVVARVESLRGRMGAAQSTRQVEGLFESLLAQSFAN